MIRKIPRLACVLCGEPRPHSNKKHCSRRCKYLAQTGANSSCWKGGRTILPHGYAMVRAEDNERAIRKYVVEHTMKAERALGYAMPPGAVVHHHDRNRANNTNTNLVICQDAKYHRLLHSGMRLVGLGANPDTESFCAGCKQVKPLNEFGICSQVFNGRSWKCRLCARLSERMRYVPKIRAHQYVRKPLLMPKMAGG